MADHLMEAHRNDRDAHDLAALRAKIAELDFRGGIWQAVASDTFSGVNGPLATVETGGQPWASWPGNHLNILNGVAVSSDGALRGSYFLAGAADGQVSMDSDPGNGEASLYFRWHSNGNYLLLLRGPNGEIALRRVINGVSTNVVPDAFRAPQGWGRLRALFIGARIMVFYSAGGIEELIFDVEEAQWASAAGAGLRIMGSGKADNFRLSGWKAI